MIQQTNAIAPVKYEAPPKNELRDQKIIAIKRGCKNENCLCTGSCNDIIGYRELPLEERSANEKW